MSIREPIHSELDAFYARGLRIGGGLFALVAVGALLLPRFFLGPYLVAFFLALGLSLGSMALLMIQHLTGGMWGAATRRVLEAGTRLVPLVTLLFLPIVIRAASLYPWAQTGYHLEVQEGAMPGKDTYLSLPFFAVRAMAYFLVWNVLALLLNRWGREQEERGSLTAVARLRAISGPGLVAYGLTLTFASVDWAMSLDPLWFSTIYGVIFMVGQGATALSFVIQAAILVARRRGPEGELSQKTLADLGSLLLAFVMLWAYIGLSQFLIIWSGNLPEEIPWYLARMRGGWGVIGLLLVLLHFALPFAWLLSARNKRTTGRLLLIARVVLIMRAVDLFWILGPSLPYPEHRVLQCLLVPLALLGMCGFWLTMFVRQLGNRPLTPYTEVPSAGHAAGQGVTS